MRTKIIVFSLFLGSAFFIGCKATKDTIKVSDEMKEVITPCSDQDYHTDKNFFRAAGTGNSVDLSTSKNKARLDATAQLAASINTVIKSVTDRYTNDRAIGAGSEFGQKFEELTRAVVNQSVNNISVVCTKSFTKDGKYTSFIAIEVAKDEVLNNINNSISNDKKLRQDYDYEKYKETFNKEMENHKSEQNK